MHPVFLTADAAAESGALSSFWEKITRFVADLQIPSLQIMDWIDLLCVSLLLYLLIRFIWDRRAGRLAMGILILIPVYFIASLLGMYLLKFLLGNLFQIGMVLLVILFQPEIRSMLEKVGATPIRGFKSLSEAKGADTIMNMIGEVTQAVGDLSESRTGALIVFERNTKLGDLILTGTVVDAYPAAFLIKNIFYNKAPLHDGAMIIRDGRIHAAGCLLPLSSNPDIIKDLGTRHRAGIGMSENSDAVVVIVSEETGTISTAVEGNLKRNYTVEMLRVFLSEQLIGEGERKRFDLIQMVRSKLSVGNKEKAAQEGGGKSDE